MTLSLHYVVGAAVGVGAEHSSIAVLEQHVERKGDNSPVLKEALLRHLEQLPLDAGYPAVMDAVQDCIDRVKPREEDAATDVVVDVTGCGRAAAALMKSRGLIPITVQITGSHGDEIEAGFKEWRLPRSALIGGLQLFYQTSMLRVGDIPLAERLKKQLLELKLQAPRFNGNDPDAWREMPRDDLVLALALATWRVSRYTPYVQPPDRYAMRKARVARAGSWITG